MDTADFRKQFPGAAEQIYMDAAARGLMPARTRDALHAYLDGRVSGFVDKAAMFAQIESLRSRFAEFIGAGAAEVALTKNVSEGLNAIVAAYPWRAGDSVVFCPDLEHPNNVYPWRNLAQRHGVRLVTIPAVDGQIDADQVIDAIDATTRMVSVSTVTFAPGLVTPVGAIGAACRERDVLLLADAVQSVGLLDTDVDALGIDALAVSTQKGLLALYGLGFLYCRAAWAERLEPAYLARFSVDLGDAHEAATGGDDYRLASGARRFEIGNYNFAGAVAAEASLRLLQQLSGSAVETQVRRLSAKLATGFSELGLPLIGPPEGAARGIIVCVGALGNGGHDSVDDPRLTSLAQHLQAGGACFSIRRGLLRFSLHAYNHDEDVNAVLDLAREWTRREGADAA
ncbi:MAG: aminotransferase class V-fold PLP-dependent enzyme [Pseudomonadota bacterium]